MGDEDRHDGGYEGLQIDVCADGGGAGVLEGVVVEQIGEEGGTDDDRGDAADELGCGVLPLHGGELGAADEEGEGCCHGEEVSDHGEGFVFTHHGLGDDEVDGIGCGVEKDEYIAE